MLPSAVFECGSIIFTPDAHSGVDAVCNRFGSPNCQGSIRFTPGGVIGHHPYRLFTRVILAGLFIPGISVVGLAQAELAGSGDRRAAVLDAQFAVDGALVGFHSVQ